MGIFSTAEADAARPAALIAALRAICGRGAVLTGDGPTRPYRQGFRFGEGAVAAVVRPANLVEMWRCFEACVGLGACLIVQAANTGLTGGSTPDGADYGRPVVIVSTRRLARFHLIRQARQVICLPGATLHQLETALRPLGREPHSVIGSSCIGASVIGGVCNNSGGALVQRGPAYTRMALFARVSACGKAELVNHLGVALGDDPVAALTRLEAGAFTEADIAEAEPGACADHHYAAHVRDISAPTPARYNADPARLYEASGSAGKVMVLAVRLDTFAAAGETADFYIGTNDPDELTALRRAWLADFAHLPIQAEYLHADMFKMAETYGKDMFLAVDRLGTAAMPRLFAAKAWVDRWAARLPLVPANLADRLMQAAGRLAPPHLPPRIRRYRAWFEHHLIIRMGGAGPEGGIEEARRWLAAHFPSRTGAYFECRGDEGRKAFLHRFAAAGAALRYSRLYPGEVAGLVALDMALPRNTTQWRETLPPALAEKISHKLYYGHFFCQVFHQDYIVRRGYDPLQVEHELWGLLDARGAEYPAEHNVGHLYPAKPALAGHYRALDPTNSLNPGIGQTSKAPGWA